MKESEPNLQLQRMVQNLDRAIRTEIARRAQRTGPVPGRALFPCLPYWVQTIDVTTPLPA